VTRQLSPLLRSHWLSFALSGLILLCVFLAWSARDRILQGNSDFIIYYTGARIVQAGRGGSLYDLELQGTTQRAVLESIGSQFQFFDGLLPYNHPPFEILFFLPLSGVPYLSAFVIWGAVGIACVGISLVLLSRDGSGGFASREMRGYLLVGFALLPVWINLIQGQDSAITLLFLTLAFLSFRKSSDVRAGLWLSLLLQRFQFLPLILLLLLFRKRWRALAGFAAGALALLLACVYVVGISGLRDYGLLVIEMTGWIDRKGIYPSQMQCLRGQAYAIWYPEQPLLANGATALATLALMGVLLLGWRGPWEPRTARFDFQFALLLLVSLVASPHLNFHDLTLLLLPLILILRNTMERNLSTSLERLRVWTLMLAYPVTLIALVVLGWGPLRVMAWGMLTVILLVWRKLRRSEPQLLAKA